MQGVDRSAFHGLITGKSKPDLVAWLVAILLSFFYISQYLRYFSFQGVAPALENWWRWGDQGHYFDSARAFALHDFSSGAHWYPLGYSVLGSLFYKWSPFHAFFWVDLASLLLTFYFFLCVATRLGVNRTLAALIFFGAVYLQPVIFAQWTIPWTSSPLSAMIWALFAACADHLSGRRRPLLIGALFALIPMFRPIDALVASACALTVAASDLIPGEGGFSAVWTRFKQETLGEWAKILAAFVVTLAPYLALHLKIYGLHPSDYMLASKQIGLTLNALWWKFYIVMINPRAWFLDGAGVAFIAPYIVPAWGGMIVAFRRGPVWTMLALTLIFHTLIYVSYIDMVPPGLLRFNNIHYWKWTLPAYGLLAWLALRELVFGPGRRLALAGLAVALILFCIRIDPVETADGSPARMIIFPGPKIDFDKIYFGPYYAVRDEKGALYIGNHDGERREIKGIPVPEGVRLFGLTRDFGVDFAWVDRPDHWVETGPGRRFSARFGFGWPCPRCTPQDPLLGE